MAEITAALVKELREMTGLGMMECKKALMEAGGELHRAEALLRIKSGAKASKAAGRIAAEGVIGAWISGDAQFGALVELNCETDFVARNEDFLAFAGTLAEIAAKDEAGLASPELEQKRQRLVQKIGENISIRRSRRLQAKGKLALYLHGAKIGALVDYEGAEDLGRDLAMHVSFYRPQFLSRTEVPAEVIAQERKIHQARAKQSGKPAEIAARMVDGSMKKFLGEITLLGQPFVKDDKQAVEKVLAARKGRVLGFAFLVVGEGIARH